jgi:HK97 family phage major capsid protein
MRIVTLDQVQKDLQNLADQVGENGFVNAKALYMEKVAVVDEDGTPLTADEIEVVLMPKPADNQQDAMEEEEEEKAVEAAPAPKAAPAPRRKAASVAARMSAPAIARPKVWGSLKNFKSDDRGDAVDKALRFGHWLLASKGNRKSLSFCDRHGIQVKAHTEGVNSAGGFLVPDEFETELISLREEFGVFRREARVRPMSSDTLRVPRRSATLSASFVGEATAGTESTQTFESVLLVAKKAMVLTTVSNELNEDAFVNLADDVAGEIAYAFAKKEDECGFVGDGTSTYGGIEGVATKLASGTADVSYVDGTLTTSADISKADIHSLMSLLPAYADTPNTKFYMHKSTWHGGFERALIDFGGTSGREIADGYRGQPSFLGYPVVFTQAMESGSYAANSAVALFGDLTLAASFGDRRQTTIQISDAALNAFEQDELAIRGTERFDINVHDTGSSTVSGPIVALRA